MGGKLTSQPDGRADVLKYSWMEQPQPDSSGDWRGCSSGDTTPATEAHSLLTLGAQHAPFRSWAALPQQASRADRRRMRVEALLGRLPGCALCRITPMQRPERPVTKCWP